MSGYFQIFRRKVLRFWHLQEFSFDLLPTVYVFSIRFHRAHHKYLLQTLLLYSLILLSSLLLLELLCDFSVVKWLPWGSCKVGIRIFCVLVVISGLLTTDPTFRSRWLMVLAVAVSFAWLTLVRVILCWESIEFRALIVVKVTCIQTLQILPSKPGLAILMNFFALWVRAMEK